jgi:MFS family permease
MESEQEVTRPSIGRLLRQGPFGRYMAGEAVSMTGTWMQVMAQSWVMANLTDRAAVLGLSNFASGLPMLALTLLGGSYADRYDKRKILILTQVVQILFALFLGTLIALERIQIWHIILAAGLKCPP